MTRVTEPSAVAMPPRDFEAAINGLALTGFRVSGRDGARPRGLVASEVVFGMPTAHVAYSDARVTRSADRINGGDSIHYLLISQEEGHTLIQQDDCVYRLGAGDLMLIDTTRPSEFTFYRQYHRQVVVHIPRVEVHERVGAEDLPPLVLPAGDRLAVALREIIGEGLALHDAGDRLRLRDVIVGLVAAAAMDRGFGKRQDDETGAQHLTRILAFVDDHFHQPDLGLQDIADAVGLSARQVQRAFAPFGRTPSQYLLEKRLERADDLLTSRDHRPRAIAEIALDSGFNDVSYFNRRFREAFGSTPSARRAAALEV